MCYSAMILDKGLSFHLSVMLGVQNDTCSSEAISAELVIFTDRVRGAIIMCIHHLSNWYGEYLLPFVYCNIFL
jgi:hypothetical protein